MISLICVITMIFSKISIPHRYHTNQTNHSSDNFLNGQNHQNAAVSALWVVQIAVN
jgi:hypothetical protein